MSLLQESVPESRNCPESKTSGPGANPDQIKAVHHFTGPCEILAGPGSGKTFVLVQRILFLIRDRHIDPARILVLTFSKAAALEMQRRFSRVSSPETYPVVFGTFHSVFYRILRESSDRTFTLINDRQQSRLFAVLIRRYLHHPPRGDEMATLSSLISRTKSTGRFPVEGTEGSIENFRRMFRDYSIYLEENDLIDFDDMIEKCRQLLVRSPEVLAGWRERFHFFMVDEFQDINAGQFEILRLLAQGRNNLFVVGDDDQSIYGFRGSDPTYMMRFREIYPGTERIDLRVNYRCRAEIVRLSQSVIRENSVRLGKQVQPDRTGEDCVHLLAFVSEKEQYEGLCRMLEKMGPQAAEQTAVIVRSHAQMQGLIRVMEREGVPFRRRGSQGKRNAAPVDRRAQEELRLILGYLHLAEELAHDDISRQNLFLVMNRPERYLLRRDFGKENYTEEELLSIFPQGSREAELMRSICRDLKTLRRLSPEKAVRYLTGVIGLSIETPGLSEALEAAAARCRDTAHLQQRLEDTDLKVLLSGSGADPGEKEPHGVNLLTMHACKGLEFDTVFLPDLNEGILPNRRARSEQAIEEERRLFYVAMTRARDELNLLYIRGDKENPRLPSRFLHPLGVKDWEDG